MKIQYILFIVFLILVCVPILAYYCKKFGKLGEYRADQLINKKKNKKVN